jgi:dipeptidyl aminopeptidase/acylaminoacyl peptidase
MCSDDGVIFTNFKDQKVYRYGSDGTVCLQPGNEPFRFADYVLDSKNNRLIGVREDHTNPSPSKVKNSIVSMQLDGSGEQTVLAEGHDFYASPTLNSDGDVLAFVAWDHPNMPWDDTALYTLALGADGSPGDLTHVGGGSDKDESIASPSWCPVSGRLLFVSDRTNWWNIYAQQAGEVEGLMVSDAEYVGAPWVLGRHRYGFFRKEWLLCTCADKTTGTSQLLLKWIGNTGGNASADADTAADLVVRLEAAASATVPLPQDVSEVAVVDDETIMVLGGGASHPTAIYLVKVDTTKLSGSSTRSAAGHLTVPVVPVDVTMLTSSFGASIEAFTGYLSQPQQLEFPTASHAENGESWNAFANYYPPTNSDYAEGDAAAAATAAAAAVAAAAADGADGNKGGDEVGSSEGSGDASLAVGDPLLDDLPMDDLPPVLVKIHGGPTSRASTTFRLDIQFWTSRGFAVLDVNYGGSTGFGRAYRKRLAKNWGVVDVDDCCAAVEHLVSRGLASSKKCCIDGGSAGGFTTLACLVRPDTPFSVGCSKVHLLTPTTMAVDCSLHHNYGRSLLLTPTTMAVDCSLHHQPWPMIAPYTHNHGR